MSSRRGFRDRRALGFFSSLVGALLAGAAAGAVPPKTMLQPSEHPPATAPAPDDRDGEKARLILEMAAYVEWPPERHPSDRAPIDIGVLGDEPMQRALEKAAGDWHRPEHPVRIRAFRTLDEFEPCAILVVGRDKARLMPVILDFLSYVHATHGLLTVGDGESFVAQGGAVGLLERPERIAFEIDLATADRAGLRFRSDLLRLAERVHLAD